MTTGVATGVRLGASLDGASRIGALRVLLILALIPPATARHWFSTSTECDERRNAGECVVNPYVMDQQCAGWCAGLPLVDALPECASPELGSPFTLSRARLQAIRTGKCCMEQTCWQRGNDMAIHQCNATCEPIFRAAEEAMAPSNFEQLVDTIVPVVVALALIVVMARHLVAAASPWLLPKLYTAPSLQVALVKEVERQERAGSGAIPVGQAMICGYYILEEGSMDPVLTAAALLVFYAKLRSGRTRIAALTRVALGVLVLYSVGETVTVVLNVVLAYLFRGELFINELMSKKLAIGGVLVLLVKVERPDAVDAAKALPGADAGAPRSLAHELTLLAARLLTAMLFAHVGFFECARVLRGQLHEPPDGHDHLWPKLAELLFVLPYIVGLRTGVCSQCLAIVLVMEALTAWPYWAEQVHDVPTLFHSRHSKDHFATNVAVAGGLLLLQQNGAGKYTLDAWLKKKD